MSAKKITWGDIIKRSQQNKPKDSEINETDASDRLEEKPASDSTDNEIQERGENDSFCNDSLESSNWDKYSYPSADLPNAGVGHTIVCQVIPSHGAD